MTSLYRPDGDLRTRLEHPVHLRCQQGNKSIEKPFILGGGEASVFIVFIIPVGLDLNEKRGGCEKGGKRSLAGTKARSQSGEFISKWATEIDHVTLGGRGRHEVTGNLFDAHHFHRHRKSDLDGCIQSCVPDTRP